MEEIHMADEAPNSGPLAAPPSRWFVVRGGEPVGPLSPGSLLRELGTETAPGEVLVWTPALEGWRPASEVPLLAALLGEESAPPPTGGPAPPPVPFEAPGDARLAPSPGGKEEEGAPAPRDEQTGSAPDRAEGRSARSPGTRETREKREEREERNGAPTAAARAADWIAGHLWPTALAGVLLAAAAGWIGLSWLGAPGSGRGGAGGEIGWLPEDLPAARQEAIRRHAATLADSVRALAPADPRRETFLARPLDGAYQTRLAFEGLRRLPDSAVLGYATSWSRVLEGVDESVCGRLSRWAAISPTVWRAVAGLEPPELDGFLETVRHAVLAEMTGRRRPRLPPPASEMGATYEALLSHYDPAVSDTLADLLTRHERTGPESCRADRLLYGAVAELGPPHSARLARAIVSPRR